MDKLLRFSDYDVFAYVVSGFAAIVAWDRVFTTHYVVGAKWSVPDGIIVIVAAYVIGQILASPSSWLLERRLVRRALGRPADVLMQGKPTSGWRGALARSVLADYYAPLDAATAGRLRELMDAESIKSGEALFWRAYPTAKAHPVAYARLEAFLKLYGFCRNLAFVALIAAVALGTSAAVAAARSGSGAAVSEHAGWAAIALMIGLGMLQR
ncbi:hypothetical protein GCM10011529_30540 [Polymorphobacter glacialis]|uniref:Uncharacterized protein n=1 Tax=Sandarakinorhabdus glacialis TaxID=1614636 RepID=A0A917A180_9SPHN|nr:hypothetical protein [Polymorphobacter glacialis]GGE21796.1 hypothetical protein GCM10011529_30540 [Polymorphobacter glacialis]